MGKCKLFNTQYCHLASLVAQRVKRLPAMQETRFDPWVRKIRWRRKWQPTPVLLPGKSHGWRSLIGYSPWCHKESDMTEQLHFHFHNRAEAPDSNPVTGFHLNLLPHLSLSFMQQPMSVDSWMTNTYNNKMNPPKGLHTLFTIFKL